MFVFVSGAVRSGKSAWAERCAVRLAGSPPAGRILIYLATARVFDPEMRARVAAHQAARSAGGFLTVERPRDLYDIVPQLPIGGTVLLECLGTWASNELFDEDGHMADVGTTLEKIYRDVRRLRERAAHLVLVSNDIFSDGVTYGREVECYRELLGELHTRLAPEADVAIECVAGIPMPRKTVKNFML